MPARDDAHERIDEVRVELPAALPVDLRDRVLHAPRVLVGTLLRQGVEHVRDRYDPAGKRDGVVRQAGVAAAVPALVMAEGDLLGDPQDREAAARENARADRRVRLDELEL